MCGVGGTGTRQFLQAAAVALDAGLRALEFADQVGERRTRATMPPHMIYMFVLHARATENVDMWSGGAHAFKVAPVLALALFN